MDIIGRLTFAEIREGAWRAVQAIYPTSVNANTGEEAINPVIDRLYSKQNMDRIINESLTGRYLDLVGDSDHIFSDMELVDIKKDVTEYALPDDMAILRGLFWKDPHVSLLVMPHNERGLMPLIEGTEDIFTDTPSYRRQLNNFVLNDPPKQDNDGGVLVQYTKWIMPLTLEDQVIETQFARVLQEIVILEAAALALGRYAHLDATELRASIVPWEKRLAILARNSTSPPFIYMRTDQHPLSGRAAR